MFKKYIVPLIGVVAFILGGIIARAKSFEIIDTVEGALTKKPKPVTPEEQ